MSISPGEQPLVVFVSSVMHPTLEWARETTKNTFGRATFLMPWLFEFTPGSSEPIEDGYLRKVREADFVVWLVGEETTVAVQKEIREAVAASRRLLVVKLPTEKRSTVTEDLLKEVGVRAKWLEIRDPELMEKDLELTINDEIIRAVRGKPGLGRTAILEEHGRASRARCIMRWQAAGVRREQALELADNSFIGAPGSGLEPTKEKPLVILVGEVGAGKSLVAERIFQKAIIKVRNDSSAPVPIYLEAMDSAVEDLQEIIIKKTAGLGNPKIQGAAIIIDGADEIGTGLAAELLHKARVLIESWPNSRVIITSRPTNICAH